MTSSLAGKACIVTGGASGIGRACVQVLAAQGARVVLADHDQAGAASVVEELTAAGHEVLSVRCDVRELDQVEAVVEQTEEAFGPVDVAISSAGVLGGWSALHEVPPARWHDTLEVNLTGTWHLLRSVLAGMRARGQGAIVAIASVAGSRGFPDAGAYAASKHGVLGLVRTAALEAIRDGVRVNAVCPGPVETPMLTEALGPSEQEALEQGQPAKRFARSEEVANAVAFLAGPGASGISGACLPVDLALACR